MPRSSLRIRPSWLAGASRWRRMTAAAGSIGAAAVLIGVVVVTELPGSSQGASAAPAVAGATTVQRRDLVATDTVAGTLSYAKPQTVFNRLTGTVTSLPSVGQVIASGQTLYRVSGNPVVLFNGTVPAYRDLTAGDTNGADILELNRALRALGFDTGHQIALNDTWQAATTTAIQRWQGSVGETESGTITLGQIVFLSGPQRITTLDTVLGSTGGASGSTGSVTSTTGAAYTGVAPRAQLVSLTTTPAPTATTATTPATATTATIPANSATATTTATSPATSTTPAKSPGTCTSAGMRVQPGGATGATTAPTTTPSPTPATTTPSSTPTCSSPGSSKSGGRTPSQAAQLLALLKAETQELKKTLTGSGGSSGISTRGSSASSSASPGGTRSASTGSAGVSGSAGSGGAGGGSASSAGASSSSGSASGAGATGGTAQAILQTTSNQLQVTVNLDATKQSEAVVGERVTVQLPSGTTVDGRITAVSPVAQSSSSSSSGSGSSSSSGSGGSSSTPSSTIPVTIKVTGRHPLSGLDQAAVSVNFQQQMEKNVLSVPVSALLATAGGGYSVQEAAKPHRLIAVTPGLFAAGYVQISGVQVFPGLQVTDSQG